MLERFGQQPAGFGLGLTLGPDGVGLGQPDVAPLDRFRLGARDAFGLDGFGRLLAPPPVGRRILFDVVAIGVGFLAHDGVELELLALDLFFGNADVLHLDFHLTALDRLGVGDVDFFPDRGLLEQQPSVGLGDAGVDLEALLFFLLASRLLLQSRVAIRVSGGDTRHLERFLDLGLAQRVEIALVVLDLLKDERLELESHGIEIAVGLFAHLVLERPLVAVERLDGERADDATQVAGDSLLDGGLDLLGGHAQE